jgi:hypothetical protein
MTNYRKALLVGSVGSLKSTAITIGTFYALKQSGYEIVGMCGASGGSIALPVLAQDKSLDWVLECFSKVNGDNIFDQDISQQAIDWFRKKIGIPRKGDMPFSGLLRGNGLRRELTNLYKYAKCSTFEDAKIPFTVMTTLIGTKERQLLDNPVSLYLTALQHSRSVKFFKGDVVRPIRASTAIPLVFRPEKIGDETHVDGGTLDSIPVLSAIRQYGLYDTFLADATTDLIEEPLYVDSVNNIIEVAIASVYTMYKEATLTKVSDAIKLLQENGKQLVRVNPPIKIKMGETEKLPSEIAKAYAFAIGVINAPTFTSRGLS